MTPRLLSVHPDPDHATRSAQGWNRPVDIGARVTFIGTTSPIAGRPWGVVVDARKGRP
jgi:hypothetical protein